MIDPITVRIIELLMASRHAFLSLTELYRTLVSEGLMSWFDPDMFEDFLASDEQFVILEGLGDLKALVPMLNIELDIHDFWDDPLVMLRSRAANPQVVVRGVLDHLREMNEALEIAWNLRPTDDPEVEAELISMLMMGDMLERELRDVLHIHARAEEREPLEKCNLSDV